MKSAYDRALTTPVRYHVRKEDIYGGSVISKKQGFFQGALNALEGGGNKLVVTGTAFNHKKVCNDVFKPNEKKKLSFEVSHNNVDVNGYETGVGNFLAPFNLYSASAGELTNNQGQISGSQIERQGTILYARITDYHNDYYGDESSIPMQGPFTDKHVGGRQVRHQNLNTGAANPDTTIQDTSGTRGESWDVAAAGGIDEWTPRIGDSPRAVYYRDQIAKRPLNIKNIKWGTSSANVGNYQTDYDIVQIPARTTNNKFFIKNEGFNPPVASSPFVSGVVDFALPDYELTGTNKFIFVSRFSAPGGSHTLARGAMDVYAEEFSPYNELNLRNLVVRKSLNQWYTEHCGQFGISPTGSPGDGTIPSEHTVGTSSYEGVIAAYQKVNRNPRKRAFLTDGFEGTAMLSESYDNWFIQHPIPRSDLQYSWIANSVTQEPFASRDNLLTFAGISVNDRFTVNVPAAVGR